MHLWDVDICLKTKAHKFKTNDMKNRSKYMTVTVSVIVL